MYADVDEKTGETLQITKPIPLPALNVRQSTDSVDESMFFFFDGLLLYLYLMLECCILKSIVLYKFIAFLDRMILFFCHLKINKKYFS